jgi:hypothetical protein
MYKTLNTPRSFWLTILAFTCIVNLAMMRLTYLRLMELKADLLRSTWGGMLVFCFFLAAGCVWMMIYLAKGGEFPILERLQLEGLIWRVIGSVIFIAVVVLIPYIKFRFQIGQEVKQPVYDPVLLLLFYYWLCWWLILLAMMALKAAFGTTWLGGFVCALVLLGVAYEIMTRFNVVTDYPFSLGWSEGSRYYYASLLFSEKIYGESVPLSPYHASRYILQSIPFIFPGLGIFEHRFWQFLLWIGLTAGAAIALASRVVPSPKRSFRWLLAAWLFLYFLRVGVYYHLQVMVIVIVLGVSGKHPWRSLLSVIFASLWAGISRVNWYAMPAMMAIALYLLETPLTSAQVKSFKQFSSYFFQPVLWMIAGLLAALMAQAAYISLSGNADNTRAFTSSFTSDLLWYRLLPNESYPMGVIFGILLVSGPLLLGLISAAMGRWHALHQIRWIGLFGMILVLFSGSMIVSVKIGGGGDLHNTDTYAVLLSLIAMYFIGGQVKPDSEQVDDWMVLNPVLVSMAVITPILFLIPALAPYPKYRENISQSMQEQLMVAVNEAKGPGPVLFISERQMITFGNVNIPLVPNYEVIILMEMAMSGNQPYLEHFYSDLQHHRFAAIVAGKQNLGIKEDGVFYEENNAWNSLVSPYVLCYYETTQTIETELRDIQIFTPRKTTECSLP